MELSEVLVCKFSKIKLHYIYIFLVPNRFTPNGKSNIYLLLTANPLYVLFNSPPIILKYY